MSCKHIESFLYSSQQHKRNNIPHKYNLNRALILSHNNHKSITFLPACNLHLSVSPEIHSAYLLSAAKERPRFLDSASDPSTYIWDYRPSWFCPPDAPAIYRPHTGKCPCNLLRCGWKTICGRKTIRIKHKCVTVAREGNPPRILPVCIYRGMSAFKQHTADIRLFVRTDFEFHRIGIAHFLQSCLNRILTGKEQFLAGNRQGDIFIGRNFTRQVNARRFGHLFAKSLKCFIRHLFVVSLPQSFGQHLNGRKARICTSCCEIPLPHWSFHTANIPPNTPGVPSGSVCLRFIIQGVHVSYSH